MNTSPRKWTPDVIQKLTQLIADNLSAQDCSRELMFTTSAIRTKAHELGLHFISKRLKHKGCFQSTWTQSDVDTLKVLFNKGWSANSIVGYTKGRYQTEKK